MENFFKSKDGIIKGDIIDNIKLIKDAIKNHDFIITYKDDDYSVFKSMMLQRDLSLDEYIKHCGELTLSIPFMYCKTTSLIDTYNKESYKKIRELYNYLDNKYVLKFSDSCIYQVMSRIKIFLNKIPTFSEDFIKRYCSVCDEHDSRLDPIKSIIENPYTSRIKCDDITLIAPIALISIEIKTNDDGTLSYYTSNAMTLYNYMNSKIAVFASTTTTLSGKFYNVFNRCTKINTMINNGIPYDSMIKETEKQETKENPFFIYNQNNLKVFVDNNNNDDNNLCLNYHIIFNDDNSTNDRCGNTKYQKYVKPINSKRVIVRKNNCSDITHLTIKNDYTIDDIINFLLS